MYRFKEEMWVRKLAEMEPKDFSTSSRSYGQFSTAEDKLGWSQCLDIDMNGLELAKDLKSKLKTPPLNPVTCNKLGDIWTVFEYKEKPDGKPSKIWVNSKSRRNDDLPLPTIKRVSTLKGQKEGQNSTVKGSILIKMKKKSRKNSDTQVTRSLDDQPALTFPGRKPGKLKPLEGVNRRFFDFHYKTDWNI